MHWEIMIFAPQDDYETICNYIKNKNQHAQIGVYYSKYMMKIYSELLYIEIYPWRDNYRWHGYKAHLIYIPDEIVYNDEETYTLFKVNAMYGTVRPLSDLKKQMGMI